MTSDPSTLAPLLAGAARSALLPDQPGLPDLSGLDDGGWQALAELAGVHQLAPLLLRGLGNLGISCSERLRQELLKASRTAELRADRAARQLSGIVDRFNSEGIPVLVLKGAALAYSAYPSPGHRSFSDLDLLVRPADRARAAELLTGTGFAPLGGGRPEWWSEHHHHWVFVRPAALPVELHWDLTPPGSPVRLPLEQFWERSRPFPPNASAKVLAAEDELLHLAVHACKHRLRVPLRIFADALVLLTGERPLDFQATEHEARAAGAITDLQALFAVGSALGFLDDELPQSGSLACGLGRTDSDALAAYMVKAPFEEWAPAVVDGLAGGRPGLPDMIRRFLRPRAGASECRSALGEAWNAAPLPDSRAGRLRRAIAALPTLLRPSTALRGAAAAQRLFADREAP